MKFDSGLRNFGAHGTPPLSAPSISADGLVNWAVAIDDR
jgi:hypothetical protein